MRTAIGDGDFGCLGAPRTSLFTWAKCLIAVAYWFAAAACRRACSFRTLVDPDWASRNKRSAYASWSQQIKIRSISRRSATETSGPPIRFACSGAGARSSRAGISLIRPTTATSRPALAPSSLQHHDRAPGILPAARAGAAPRSHHQISLAALGPASVSRGQSRLRRQSFRRDVAHRPRRARSDQCSWGL